jgi:hypothetical protein
MVESYHTRNFAFKNFADCFKGKSWDIIGKVKNSTGND